MIDVRGWISAPLISLEIRRRRRCIFCASSCSLCSGVIGTGRDDFVSWLDFRRLRDDKDASAPSLDSLDNAVSTESIGVRTLLTERSLRRPGLGDGGSDDGASSSSNDMSSLCKLRPRQPLPVGFVWTVTAVNNHHSLVASSNVNFSLTLGTLLRICSAITHQLRTPLQLGGSLEIKVWHPGNQRLWWHLRRHRPRHYTPKRIQSVVRLWPRRTLWR